MFFNRDLSWLGFNLRVLQEAADSNVPLFERMKFLAIFSSNLDEFFRVRYPYVLALSQVNKKTKALMHAKQTKDLAEEVQTEINKQLELFGYILREQIIPALQQNGIIFYYHVPILKEHEHDVTEIFLSNVLSFIQPIFLEGDISKKFIPENNKLYLIVNLQPFNQNTLTHAVVNIPSEKLPRFFVLPPVNGYDYVIFIDDIIRENLVRIFPNMEVKGAYSIKFNRDADINLTNEYTGDVLHKIEKQLRKREFGAPSRFLFEQGMPKNIQLFLASAFNLEFDEMFAGARYHNLKDLSSFPKLNKDLSYKDRKALNLPEVIDSGDIFNVLNEKDILLHVPYQSYNLVLAFFNQAAVDPSVTEIYITLYRVAADSHIVNALISAAKNGKEVTVFIELKARFDEANNINWSRQMKKAGVKIIYSLPDIKVHSKIALIKKEAGNVLQWYAILSTGNFNETTAQLYTDHVLITSDVSVTKELMHLVDFLKKNDADVKAKLKFKKIWVSQFNMYNEFEKKVEDEIQKALKGEEALIRIKVNNLEEQNVIELLYKASKAGVKVNLIVRSVCCLIPGVKDISKNITVRRLVDRYLEHTRIFIFGADNSAEVIMGSADLMNRNLHSRIEVCITITNEECKKELIDYFEMQWNDNDKMVELNNKLEQHKIASDGVERINAQESIYLYLQH